MEYEYIKQSKSDYIKLLIKNGDLERAKEIIALSDYEPVLKVREVHEQENPDVKDINENTYEIYRDLCSLIVGYRNIALDYYALMKNTKTKLNDILLKLEEQKQYHESVNILCNKYTNFNNVIPITDENLTGNFTYSQGMISAKIISTKEIDYDIVDIKGNGYEGNKYIYFDNDFLQKSLSTANQNFIKDNNNLTIYEYSRITANNTEKYSFTEVNYDEKEAECSIQIYSPETINHIKILCTSKDTILKDISFSSDGIKYLSILKEPCYLFDNLKNTSQTDTNYLANTGLFCFPDTNYLKIVLTSNGITDEQIAFEKILIEEKKNTYPQNNNKDLKIDNIQYNQTTNEIEKVKIQGE